MTPSTPSPSGSRLTSSPTRPGRVASPATRPRSARGGTRPGRPIEQRPLGGRRTPGCGQESDVRQRVVEARAAERPEDARSRRRRARRPRGRPARCRTRPWPRPPDGSRRRPPRAVASSAGSTESPSPTHRSMGGGRATPAWRAPPSAAMTRAAGSAQPGQAASRPVSRSDVAVGKDDRLHGPDATTDGARSEGSASRSVADARLRAVPDPLDHPAIRRVIDAAARKGVAIEVTVFDESTHTAQEAAAAVGAELGQIVKSLVFVRRRRRRAGADRGPRLRPGPGRRGASRRGHRRRATSAARPPARRTS